MSFWVIVGAGTIVALAFVFFAGFSIYEAESWKMPKKKDESDGKS